MKWTVWAFDVYKERSASSGAKQVAELPEEATEEDAIRIAEEFDDDFKNYLHLVRPGLPDNPRLKQATREERQE